MEGGKLSLRDFGFKADMTSFLDSIGVTSSNEETIFSLTKNCKEDVSSKLGIPSKFYQRLETSQTDMLDYNVSELLKREPGTYFLRSFQSDDGTGIARAFLSDSYRVIDNLDVLTAALSSIKDTGVNIKIESCDITESSMHARFYLPDVEVKAPELLENYRGSRNPLSNDGGIFGGFSIRNSETGRGKFSITPRLIVGACRNGMVFKQDATSRIHLGSKMEAGIVKSSQETMDKEYSLIMSEIKDAVNTFSSKEFLEGKINRILGNNHRIAKPQEAIENVVKWSGLPNELTDDLLSAFIDGGDVTRFGIAQAMTWVAYDHADAELALELESSAAELMTASLQLN
jgi:hypothetical protein